MSPVVVIDPGHGGWDPGAIGPAGTRECDVALQVALRLRGLLVPSWTVIPLLTRYDDSALADLSRPRTEWKADDLQRRADLANAVDADAFLSIHCNSFSSPTARGFEVWTSPGGTRADRFATLLYHAFEEGPGAGMTGRSDYADGDPDKESRFRVLTATRCPAALFELGFISNPHEEQVLRDAGFMDAAARCFRSALNTFLKEG